MTWWSLLGSMLLATTGVVLEAQKGAIFNYTAKQYFFVKIPDI